MAYSGRRGPNVSEFVANLNELPSTQDLHERVQDNPFDDIFTNTEFFDYDLGQASDLQPSFGSNIGQDGEDLDIKPLDFQADFAFPDFDYSTQSNYDQTTIAVPPAHIQKSEAVYSAPSTSNSPSSFDLSSATSGTKRKASVSSPQDLEDASRYAAEEDKRRRNTAASARFRVKKKQREQALEKSAKDMCDKVSALEGRITQLETENKWLKNLVVEKNGNDDVESLWKKYNSEHSDIGERIASERKDGVGTKA